MEESELNVRLNNTLVFSSCICVLDITLGAKIESAILRRTNTGRSLAKAFLRIIEANKSSNFLTLPLHPPIRAILKFSHQASSVLLSFQLHVQKQRKWYRIHSTVLKPKNQTRCFPVGNSGSQRLQYPCGKRQRLYGIWFNIRCSNYNMFEFCVQ